MPQIIASYVFCGILYYIFQYDLLIYTDFSFVEKSNFFKQKFKQSILVYSAVYAFCSKMLIVQLCCINYTLNYTTIDLVRKEGMIIFYYHINEHER